jgi:hypothetical protein
MSPGHAVILGLCEMARFTPLGQGDHQKRTRADRNRVVRIHRLFHTQFHDKAVKHPDPKLNLTAQLLGKTRLGAPQKLRGGHKRRIGFEMGDYPRSEVFPWSFRQPSDRIAQNLGQNIRIPHTNWLSTFPFFCSDTFTL